MSELVIGVSNIISPLCSSVLRVEPYTECSHGCLYCYAMWYRRGSAIVRDRLVAIKSFAYLARVVRKRGLKPIPARLSTLSDPLQPHEELFKASLKVLRIALEYEYPIILNTKSSRLAREPWRKVLEKLGELGLLVVQVSISTLREDVARVLEPVASSPAERLRAASELCSSCGAPLVLRLSPFAPPISLHPGPRELAELLKELGVAQVVVEGLRVLRESEELFEKIVGEPICWEPYSLREVEGLKPVSRICLSTRLASYLELARELRRVGIGFATCKEGLFHLHTAENCCGMHMLRDATWRPTLFEVYRVVSKYGELEVSEAVDRARKEFSDRLWSDALDSYPRIVSKPLKYHEKKMLKVLRNSALLQRVCPSLRIEGGKLVLAHVQ